MPDYSAKYQKQENESWVEMNVVIEASDDADAIYRCLEVFDPGDNQFFLTSLQDDQNNYIYKRDLPMGRV